MKYFSPTSELKELLLLQHIEEKPDTTQVEIARVIGGATSMVNVYIDRLENDGYLVRDYKSAKIVYYNITPEGVKRKNYLAITYLNELIELSRLAMENIEKILIKLNDKGYKNMLVYGAGQVAEILLGIINTRKDKPLNVLALVDDDKNRQGRDLLGHRIISRQEIKNYNHDGILIASYGYENDMIDKLKEIGYPENKIEKFFAE